MATEPPPQRAYRAACPNCGAPVEFRSAASAFAVCSYCRSTLVRDGDALRRTGESAELFDDHSPLQLGAAGRYHGAAFTLVGRLQYGYADGTWNEWHALFDHGAEGQKSGWLSEDNGHYVFAFDAPLALPVPPAEQLRPGAQELIDGRPFVVASVTAAKLIAAQGELPFAPRTDRGFVVADLRSSGGEVGTLDYSDPHKPGWSIGRAVALSELAMTGLADRAEKSLGARGIECPSCGAPLGITLDSTKSVVCAQCHAVVDVSQGVGTDLRHYAQDRGDEPQIPLGRSGTLALGKRPPQPWQVVGYVERCEVAGGDEDESSCWREYLLYHRTEGFAFLVDADDGWSWSAPITGAPQPAGRDKVRHDGEVYRKLYGYTGQVHYVLGEFYWRLERHERTHNTDYIGTGAASRKRLNREETRSGDTHEVIWSAGDTLAADTVADAFGLDAQQRAAMRRDAAPTSLSAGTALKFVFWALLIVFVLVLSQCGGDERRDCEALRSTYGEASLEYRNCLDDNRSAVRTRGGSFGGWSTGGGHK